MMTTSPPAGDRLQSITIPETSVNRTEILATAIDVARTGRGFTALDALDCIVVMVGEEDPTSGYHDANVERLLRLAACIWSLRHGLLLSHPPDSAQSEDLDTGC